MNLYLSSAPYRSSARAEEKHYPWPSAVAPSIRAIIRALSI